MFSVSMAISSILSQYLLMAPTCSQNYNTTAACQFRSSTTTITNQQTNSGLYTEQDKATRSKPIVSMLQGLQESYSRGAVRV
jgi:hypothetical protein